MLSIHNAEGMREADRYTIEDLGLPGIVLMENAATGLVEAIQERWPEAASILILCGAGNNGGDGFAAARHLFIRGLKVQVLLFADPGKLRGDALLNYRAALNFGVRVELVAGEDIGILDEFLRPERCDLVVDSLMGTGLSRGLEGKFADIAERVNSSKIPCVATDVPTGLQASSSLIPGPVIDAGLTVTFGALKTCLVLPPACLHCGDIAIADIGIPPGVLENSCRLWWVEEDDISLMLPRRPTSGHKGVFGHLLVAGGSPGKSGAVSMAAAAAVLGGSGLVTMAVPRSILHDVDPACPEAMSFALPSAEDGAILGTGEIDDLLARMTAVVAGPGLGTGAGALKLLDHLLGTLKLPMLLDADALNLLAGRLEELKNYPAPLILTPHPGELARLLGRSIREVAADRLEAAREAASRSGAVVVAKSHRTIVVEPSMEAWVIPVGDAHLGSGGSGDVLSGLTGSFLAQGLDPVRAAILGSWLHGRAGELGGEDFPAAVPASKLPFYIARAWMEADA